MFFQYTKKNLWHIKLNVTAISRGMMPKHPKIGPLGQTWALGTFKWDPQGLFCKKKMLGGYSVSWEMSNPRFGRI